MSFVRKKTKSTNTSPREDDQIIPKIKFIKNANSDDSRSSQSSPSTPSTPTIVVCPRCKTSRDVVRLGMWKEKDSAVYFCGLFFPDERACKNVWMPDMPYVHLEEVNMRYLPGPDGDYLVTFK